MTIEQDVKNWLADEGVFREKAADENADFHFVIEFPKDNVMDVVKPKEKDVIVIGCATQVAPEHISLMQNASPQEKNKFLFDVSTNLNLFLVDYELKVDQDILQQYVVTDNIYEDGLTKDAEGKTAPLSGLSSNSWLESKLIGQHNRAIVDVNTPGGMFIQMSSIAYNDLNVRTDGKVRDLKFDNKDGSIECCISINLLKTIIPDYDKKSFIESKEWLIKHGIIGRDTKAGAIGYRIPAQGPSSVAALKIVDVYPENIGDTITLPDEWTALTGSDRIVVRTSII